MLLLIQTEYGETSAGVKGDLVSEKRIQILELHILATFLQIKSIFFNKTFLPAAKLSGPRTVRVVVVVVEWGISLPKLTFLLYFPVIIFFGVGSKLNSL